MPGLTLSGPSTLSPHGRTRSTTTNGIRQRRRDAFEWQPGQYCQALFFGSIASWCQENASRRRRLRLRIVDARDAPFEFPHHVDERVRDDRIELRARLLRHVTEHALGFPRRAVRPVRAQRVVDVADVHQL